uniref:Cytochrome P450, family 2, subfamily X, polypeptide 9 n=1 Tax=Periophthalmus magnuspinnatus TaxID=409849 RepID=A0A3B4AKH9_9GOBI
MFVSFFLLWLIICFFIIQFKSRRPKNFPPGPITLPLLGNLHNLSLDNPLQDFERLRLKYGNIYSLYLGSKPMVMLCGVQAIKEALVNKAVEFAGRPQDMYLHLIYIAISLGVILADYGPRWKEHRRFALMTLRNFGLGKQSMEERILAELQHTSADLESSIGKLMFHNASSNIICQVLFGMRFDYNDWTMKEIVRCFTENAKLANGPWAMVTADTFSSVFRLQSCLSLAGEGCFATTYRSVGCNGKVNPLVHIYLLPRSNDPDSTFSEDLLSMYSLDLHFAGTDTTSNTLLTGFLYLMTNPDIQERCQAEIDRVLEGKDKACFEDRHNMPYVQAVIHEMQRIANTVPLSVFHNTTKDTEVMGYTIPKGTMVIPNLSSVLSEEGQWKFPRGFHPENFLNDQGEFVKPEAFMPFSAGPRMCLGEGLARMELFLITVTLLRKFKFIWPEDAGEPDYTPVYGVTLTPKPYFMKVQLREMH